MVPETIPCDIWDICDKEKFLIRQIAHAFTFFSGKSGQSFIVNSYIRYISFKTSPGQSPLLLRRSSLRDLPHQNPMEIAIRDNA